MTRTCCAHGCKSSSKKNPGLKFYNLSQAKGSLAEWQAAFPRRYRVDILTDITSGNPDIYSICEEHFSDAQKGQTPPAPSPDTEGIFFNCDKNTQTDNINVYSSAKLMISPVEIVDIPPSSQILAGNMCNINMEANVDTNHIPAFLAAGNIQPVIDGINIGAYCVPTYNTNTPQHQTNIVTLPGFVSNVNSMQPQKERIHMPTLLTSNIAMSPTLHSFETAKPQRFYNKQILGHATNINFEPGKIRPRILRNDVSSPNQQSNVNTVNMPRFPVYINHAIQPSSDINNSANIDNILPSDVSIKIEDDDDDDITLEENIDNNDEHNEELQCGKLQEEHRSDVIEIELSPCDGTYEISQEDENVEDYVKFEIDESNDDNIETYCFFEDDSAKRRRVETETTEGNFKIVKVEIDSEQNNTVPRNDLT